jgi:two-component sensor histidine kinase
VITDSDVEFAKYQTYKGWVFILMTTILVYVLVKIYNVYKEKSLQLLRDNEKIIRENLKEKETLLMEIHHRVKNNFQIVISLLRMKSRLVNNEILTKNTQEIIDKINAISMVHDKLYETESLSDIDFPSYIHDVVRHLLISSEKLESVKVEYDLDQIVLPIEIAVPCGILINEIISRILNDTVIHNNVDLIGIFMKKEIENRYSLIIEDNGNRKSDDNKDSDRRFEMMMINILTDQINGDIQIHSTDKGTKYSINFPG